MDNNKNKNTNRLNGNLKMRSSVKDSLWQPMIMSNSLVKHSSDPEE
jgi:hypothetical protein